MFPPSAPLFFFFLYLLINNIVIGSVRWETATGTHAHTRYLDRNLRNYVTRTTFSAAYPFPPRHRANLARDIRKACRSGRMRVASSFRTRSRVLLFSMVAFTVERLRRTKKIYVYYIYIYICVYIYVHLSFFFLLFLVIHMEHRTARNSSGSVASNGRVGERGRSRITAHRRSYVHLTSEEQKKQPPTRNSGIPFLREILDACPSSDGN